MHTQDMPHSVCTHTSTVNPVPEVGFRLPAPGPQW